MKDGTDTSDKEWGLGQSVVLGRCRLRQPGGVSEMDAYVDEHSETLNLNGMAQISDSIGGAEVARYCGRHGTTRVAKFVMVCAVPPLAEIVTRRKRT